MSGSDRPGGAALSAERVLRASAGFWYAVAAVGIWVFGYYIAALYGVGVAQGDLERWNAVLPEGHGYVPGDVKGNIALGAHLSMALIITVGGVLQLAPRIRARAPWFHRWNGRLFITVAFVAAVTGLFIALSRGAVAGDYMTAGNVINAALILVFGVMAWRDARARRIAQHQRWALRLFVVANAVWFYRLGMMLWFAVNRGPVGHTRDFTGPFDIFLAFAHVLAPLAFLELYMAARDRGGAVGKVSMAALLFVLTLAMGAGILLAAMMMWLPRL